MKKTGLLCIGILSVLGLAYWLWARYFKHKRQVVANGQRTPAMALNRETGKYITRQKMTLKELYDKYLDLVQRSTITKQTDNTYRIVDETAATTISGLLLNKTNLSFSIDLDIDWERLPPSDWQYGESPEEDAMPLSQKADGSYHFQVYSLNPDCPCVYVDREFGPDGIMRPNFTEPDEDFYWWVCRQWKPYIVTDLGQYLPVEE